MEEQITSHLYQRNLEYVAKPEPRLVLPRLFVCCEHEIMEFVLSGHQTMGRPSDESVPDIPITNRFISRTHGCFDTDGSNITYTASETTNGTVFRRRFLQPGETVDFWDGDELIIPVTEGNDAVDVLITCAIVENRIKIWRDLRLASRDALTGLPGRNTFRTWYLQNMYLHKTINACLFILDIDHFKQINDVYDHSAGDIALKALTEQLLITVGNSGYVCRWGGDEFVGVIPGSLKQVIFKLQKMGERISQMKIDDRFYMTISTGVADIRMARNAGDIDDIVLCADHALYCAKEGGRNRVCQYQE